VCVWGWCGVGVWGVGVCAWRFHSWGAWAWAAAASIPVGPSAFASVLVGIRGKQQVREVSASVLSLKPRTGAPAADSGTCL
jgi:hypothetical protein